MKLRHTLLLLILGLLLPSTAGTAAGKVYLVLGSDTAIWDGMSVNRYRNTYNPGLYTDPFDNAYLVMDPAFRAPLVDSYGTPLKLTWWMMAGNIFRYATNTNVPLPNIMTMYLMRKYHGDKVQITGDELSLHYHTFIWSDYDSDGIYWWNQAQGFPECREDFEITLAQLLIEEQVFPVSFRSGWHYMDNAWQAAIDSLWPYSLHNDYPNIHQDYSEPLDNNYDWSQAPAEFVPYHPSPQNYQIPGNGPGWNVRSAHFNRVRYEDLIDTVFAAAALGVDQVACFWGHLPEADFADNLIILDSLLHTAVTNYPGVEFRYCTAIEALQLWQQTTDTTASAATFTADPAGPDMYFTITTDEPLFQAYPFVAVKDIYEQYRVLPCLETGLRQWRTSAPVSGATLAKAAAAVTDSMGNITLKFLPFLPDDIYIDNQDAGYSEIRGNWSAHTAAAWGTDSRQASLTAGDTAIARWTPSINEPAYYNVFIQVPESGTPPAAARWILTTADSADTVSFPAGLPESEWVYLSTAYLQPGLTQHVELLASGSAAQTSYCYADVVKFSALVRDRQIQINDRIINFGEVGQSDTVSVSIPIANLGNDMLTVTDVYSLNGLVGSPQPLPLGIPGMSRIQMTLEFSGAELGPALDTLKIISDDPVNPVISLLVTALVQPYMEVIDNEDSAHYQEFGTWYYSVAQAYGPTSRYAYLGAGASAVFRTSLNTSGIFDVYEIVPTTVNSSNHAAYILTVDGTVADSTLIDQNHNSGRWNLICRTYLPAGVPVQVRVLDTNQSTAGVVIRADAIKIQLVEELTLPGVSELTLVPTAFELGPAYPNPFNAIVTIPYGIPNSARVTLIVYDLTGRQVKQLLKGTRAAGRYDITWNGTTDRGEPVSSGVYFYLLRSGSTTLSGKLLLLY